MGQYSDFYISQAFIFSDELIDPLILSLFEVSEMITFKRKVAERIQVLHGRDKADTEQAFFLQTTAKVIKDRLEVSGITHYRVMQKFELSKSLTISMLAENRANYFRDSPEISDRILEEIKLLSKSNFDDFLNVSKRKMELEIKGANPTLEDEQNSLFKYFSERSLVEFPHDHDLRVLIRALLEGAPDDTIVTYDITELVEDNYVPEYPEEIFDVFLSESPSTFPLNEKIIVLTEGSSDVQILKDAIRLLYPHLDSYYSFMDFGNSNAGGGVGPLVASIKSFAGSGITNRVIAIFDNDTAAEVALRGLTKTKLPSNIKVLQFPPNKLASNYPTIGPTGISNMNINGLACSIELYLGKDVLVKKDSLELTPVHWKGFDQTVQKYQGEIVNKELVQELYSEKIIVCLQDPNQIDKFDWEEMHSLLKSIFNAFNEDDDEYFQKFLHKY